MRHKEGRLAGRRLVKLGLHGKALTTVYYPKLEEFSDEEDSSQAATDPNLNQGGRLTRPGSGQMYALYGNVVLRRARCPKCGDMALVQDGASLCCSAPLEFGTHRAKRMSDAPDMRRGPSEGRKREIRELQGECCFYCLRKFGSYVYRGFKLVWLRVHFDHVIAYAYARNNYPDNFVAACHVCNGLKGSKLFETVQEARSFLRERWEEKGYRDLLS